MENSPGSEHFAVRLGGTAGCLASVSTGSIMSNAFFCFGLKTCKRWHADWHAPLKRLQESWQMLADAKSERT